MSADPRAWLEALGAGGDGPHDIAGAALMLSALDHPGKPLAPFVAHLREIAEAMRAAPPGDVGDGARRLSDLLSLHLGYDGDRLTYDDARNADLIAVIERRRGIPVALGILYMHAARAAGLAAQGLNTRGHFLIRIGLSGHALALDPFNAGAVIAAENLPAELGGGLARTVGDTDVLLRLLNNLKLRALEQGGQERGLEIAGRMALIAPRRPDVWFDLARLNEAMGILGASRKAYERCLAFAPAGEMLHNEAVLALGHLKHRLN
ncbi:MAG TPA: transglutaminase family protein [Rhizomicrobium sp.]|jgi:regulator of sirC expression with transglutaminase-like and TPR domain|nr:transglutaminase family protein [Rhizomicrobium sp.]